MYIGTERKKNKKNMLKIKITPVIISCPKYLIFHTTYIITRWHYCRRDVHAEKNSYTLREEWM
jgi:hypothetical protein